MLELLGYVYSFLFAGCYIPQIIQLIKTRETAGISISMYWVCLLAYTLAIFYSIQKFGPDKILLLNYGSGALFCAITMGLFYKFKKS